MATDLNESIVEDAAIAMPRASLTPTLSQKERAKDEAIRRLNAAIPEEASACASHAGRRATVADSATARTEWRLKP